jgi:hypothetical protein
VGSNLAYVEMYSIQNYLLKRLEPTGFHIRGERVNHYTTDVIIDTFCIYNTNIHISEHIINFVEFEIWDITDTYIDLSLKIDSEGRIRTKLVNIPCICSRI